MKIIARSKIQTQRQFIALSLFVCLLSLAFTATGYAKQEATGQSVETPAVTEPGQQLYGPIQRRETLWLIANRFHPDRSVSVYQTMAAIIDANPHAFPNGNVHELLSNVTLLIPSANEIRAIDAEEARQRMVAQLGGELITRASPQVQALQAQHEEELAEIRQQLLETESDARQFAERNESLQARLQELEALLEELRSNLEESAAAERELLALQRQTRPSSSLASAEQSAWEDPWKLALVALAVLAFILLLLVFRSRRELTSLKLQTVQKTPYEIAADKQRSEELEAEQAVVPVIDERQELADAAPSTTQELSAVPSEEPSAVPAAFREIDDIIEEAEADADPDSDEDDGQTAEEAAEYEHEQLAAQLDLARAYLEMGEVAEAESAIREVVQHANAELLQEAQQLLEKIKEKR
ncbi:MAG: hypothetical protein LAT77_05815 [Aliidiomarina sp.]|uniref:FimV/HubP family polar landmark protein n=1 Tax=Aliidiomarina sp. TaxID=1872439 RepID=UPI0025C0683F|nr:FimV/HubP family polar landmark protein [Aliidiomarina sp.]MCH8501415.1 hypothetical protein [Aliidiomarina sp.]